MIFSHQLPIIIDELIVDNDNSNQTKIHIARDFLGVIRKLQNEYKVVSMSTKMYSIVRNFLSLKLKRLSSLKLIKLDAH